MFNGFLSCLFVGFLGSGSRKKAVGLFERFEESGYSKATFAGGCFWGLEKAFEELDGVVEAISGYSGGETDDPSYGEVCTGETGHFEAVRVYYESDEIGYLDLLEVFWSHIAPGFPGPSDVGNLSQYTTAVFYHDETQKELAIKSRDGLVEEGSRVGTLIRPVEKFYPAEEYHQDYYTRGGSGDVGCYVPGKDDQDG
ncbi:peptide-methionine (S)-S-oxide reductase MsrA [Methanonatronarchaeum sp. AMET-Sl]|uniref:peptide-methionine (S)-S-oxide reductase MsrA n=1 Tax=Methanonatronarchaeum sp. AMET-Sl TaxID=3037654 RepID=UPI00244DF391|nr:peptide-methionine (S)-S-oxide reductase MsrA [Methanonatronarchaeum sp. AMET-Sl]WGI18066.1 peptide-methionine (S)-S-oxide reductase MsrA [Methanonatronarchaeum sp. AMET-Sl]